MTNRRPPVGGMTRRGLIAHGVAAAVVTSERAGTTLAQEATPRPMDTTNANVQLIEDYYAAYAEGDPEALRPFLAEDVTWRIPGRGPLAGEKRGVDEVLAFFAELAKGGFQAETITLAAGDDWVIDLHRGWSTEGEGSVDMTWALAFRIADGRIQEAINFAFDQYVADTYWWANYPLKPIPERLAAS